MLRISFRVLLIAAAALLTACQTVQPLPKETVDRLKRVGVVSQTADTLYKQYIGGIVFENTREPQDIRNWKLDEAYEEQLAAAVRTVLKAQPHVLAQYRSEFAEVNSLNGPWNAPAFWGPNFDKIAEVTRRACQEQSLDAVIVVARWQSEDFLGLTNQKIEGVGVYARSRTSMIHVLSKLAIMDCKSGKPLAIVPLFKTPERNAWGLEKQRAPNAPMDDEAARKPYSSWSQAEKDNLRAQLSSLPKDAWTATLGELVPAK
jgi:hypothetical protein